MNNSKYLESIKKEDKVIKAIIKESEGNIDIDSFNYKYRQVKALEIIAETLIELNEGSNCIMTVLENIDTTLNRR